MSDPITISKAARESLSRGLNALQADPTVPSHLVELAAPIAQAMGALHQLEKTNQLAPHADVALNHVRGALAQLQAAPPNHPAVSSALDSVAQSLSLVHSLTRLANPPAAAAPPPAAPTAAATVPVAPPAAPPAPVFTAPPAAAQIKPQSASFGATAQISAPISLPQQAPKRPESQPGFPAPRPAAGMPPPQPIPAPRPAAGMPAPQIGPPIGPPPQQQMPPPQQMKPQQQQMQPQQRMPPPQQQMQPQQQPVNRPMGPPMGGNPYGPPPQQQPQRVNDPFGPTAPDPFAGGPKPTTPSMPVPGPPAAGNLQLFPAELGAHSPTNFYKGLAGNDIIDHGGIFISTYLSPKLGTPVRVKVTLPGGYEFEANAVVQWTREAAESGDAPPGFGARFTAITPEARQLVYRYVRNREPLFYDDL